MRIIAGKAKGMRLKSPKGLATRPTADRVKEALFSILHGKIINAHILDLFAGTGALGLEALSRGASSAVFVEKHFAPWQALQFNIEKSGMKSQTEILRSDAMGFLRSWDKKGFDIIFLDPPYQGDLANRVLEILTQRELLKPHGIIAWEKDAKDSCQVPKIPPGFKLINEKQYGDTLLLFLKEVKEELGDGCI